MRPTKLPDRLPTNNLPLGRTLRTTLKKAVHLQNVGVYLVKSDESAVRLVSYLPITNLIGETEYPSTDVDKKHKKLSGNETVIVIL